MLLDDIAQNRHRVQTILMRLADAEGEEQLSFTLKQLALEELPSEEPHLERSTAIQSDDLDSSRVAEFTINTILEHGLKFLSRKLTNFVKSLQVSLEEIAETGKTEVRNKVAAVLEELLRRNGTSLDRYTTIKEDNNISRPIYHH